MNKQTQHQAILSILEDGSFLTGRDAVFMCDCMRLSNRIGELKEKGYNIRDEWITTLKGKRIKKYWLEK